LNNNLLFDLIEKSDCDICFVQETLVSLDSSINSLSHRWLGRSFWSPANGKQGGVAVLISPKCDSEVLSWKRDSLGRIISILVRIDNVDFNLVNIYAPTSLTDRKIFYDSLHDFFFPSAAMIIGGDFNCYDSALDKFGGNVSIHKECDDLKSDFRLLDVWRKLHPNSREFSWFNADMSIGSRLDKFLISKDLFQPSFKCDITPCPLSDHDFVSFVFDVPESIRYGPGVWKLNNSLLDDEKYCNLIRKTISDHVEFLSAFEKLQDWWDFLKESIREDSIDFARKKRKELCRDRVRLTNRLIRLRQCLVDGDESVQPLIVDIESQLKSLYFREMEGVKIRSRAKWLEEGERPTRYFFKLEQTRIQKSRINVIYDANGLEVSSQPEIEKAHVDFYTKLFSDEPIDFDKQNDLFASLTNRLSPDQSSLCEGEITLEEITNAVKGLNLGKTPGPDGLSTEFYVKFWDLLGPYLTQVFNVCFHNLEMCDTMKVSHTRVIYKKGDAKSLKNWRPISLLNVDYKICSKALSIRLAKVLHFIVSSDQTCSVPGRKISSNLHVLRDILDYIDRTNETGILLSLDQEKAFDRVNRVFLLNLLECFGFGPSFIQWISTLYNGANMQIIVNGWLTDAVPLARGVRQGDSLSPLLYILCVETLACKVKECSEIEGFLLPGAKGAQYKVGQYADDTTSFVKSVRSLERLFHVIHLYEQGSGAKLNVSKTEAMWLGAWRSRLDQPLGLTWVKKMKILGVVFGQITEQDNWQPKLNKLEKHLNLWKTRSLSFIGKSLIINILGLSKLTYLATVLTVPKWVITKVNDLVWPFLWGCRIETVSRQSCYQPIARGGLNIVDFSVKAKALKLASIINVTCVSDSKAFFMLKYFLGSRLATFRVEWSFLRDNLSPSTQILTPFYSKCLKALTSLREILSRQDWSDLQFSAKKCYRSLLKEKSSPPVLPRTWIPLLGPGFHFERHLSLIRDGFSENFKEDLLWLIVLRAIKVRDSMRSWGYIASDRCAKCNRKETIDHCFLNCSRVKRVWQHFSPTLSSLFMSPFTPNCLTVFFFKWQSADQKRNRLARYLVKTILYGIWKFRNKATFHNGTERSDAIIRYISQDIRNRIHLDHYRLSESAFRTAWESPLCNIFNDSPVVIFQ